MAGKTQLFIPALLALALLLNGCNPFDKGRKIQAPIPAEEQKARLLKQINRRFENPDAHFQLGQLYHAEGQWAEAEYRYNIALSFDPVHWPAQAAKVKVLLDSGKTAKAKEIAQNYIDELAGSAERSLHLGLAFEKQQIDEYALACYRQALQLAPKSAKIHKRIGYYYLSRNDKVRAEEYFRRSFQLDPLQPDVAFELGELGVLIDIPPKTKKKTKMLDRIVNRSG